MNELTNTLADLAVEINAEHTAAEEAARAAIHHAIRAGKLLLQAKKQCPHGTWLEWLETKVSVGARQAQKYMRLAQHPELANTNSDSHLSIDRALAALAAPVELNEMETNDLFARFFAGLPCALSENGLGIIVSDDCTFEEWLEIGKRLAMIVPPC